MAIKANGATLAFSGYEFGLMTDDGELTEISDLDTLRRHRHKGERIVFRPTYAPDWMETTNEFG